jgi:hypothetical protein
VRRDNQKEPGKNRKNPAAAHFAAECDYALSRMVGAERLLENISRRTM